MMGSLGVQKEVMPIDDLWQVNGGRESPAGARERPIDICLAKY